MRILATAIAALSLLGAAAAQAQETKMSQNVKAVAPALDKYTQDRLLGEVWKRPGLSPRDRSVVTLAAMIGRNQTIALADHLKFALDHGVKPTEISEIITHLAFYSGWANAMAAVAVTKDVFAERNIGPDKLPASLYPRCCRSTRPPRPIAQSASATSSAQCSPASRSITTDVLFRDLWLRPDLAPRDRSLVTISASSPMVRSRS